MPVNYCGMQVSWPTVHEIPGSISFAQGHFDMSSTVDQTSNLQTTGQVFSLLQPVFIVYLVRGSTPGDRSNYDRWIGRRHAM